ncbi:MAG: PAS domain S-box protein [Rhodoplanes sp.]|uniref:chemotaxis protein CheB n=1 Tax=Rhodoplanes sp. TaxID=1968906 RepID=UPI0017D3A33E|nr:chemotaxis protein CheB [Rhodoplanes sp.]NVO14818.1 PAS domain S-box protein [Rhodoplanes sp.]
MSRRAQPVRKSAANDDAAVDTSGSRGGLYVVGIGASAGGLEALRPFVAALPTSSNLCFVVAQHLSPQHRSMMVELLGRETKIPVLGINNGVTVKPNTIYIAPPNSDVFYRAGKLVLRTPLETIGPKPSIDHFFTSLAGGLGARAIAIVLSGTGSDGANGLRAVKAHGGITFAQEPASAKYESMPRAAMTVGGADLVLPPKEIAGKLAVIAQGHDLHLGLAEKSDDGGGTFQTIIRFIRHHTGIDFSKYKEATLRRQIARRMSALQIGALKEYIGYIEVHRDELDILTKNFLISVTSFFRDKESFATLGKTLDKIIKEKRAGEALRVWVPGCATGEEAYSIALLLASKPQARIGSLRVQIFGTDIDALATAHARRGEYAESSVINLNAAMLHNHFSNSGRLFRIDKAVRDMVVFSRHDVVQDPPFKNMDLISCRNMLIYFKPTLQEHIFKLFHYALRPGGHLFLGKSESLGSCKSLFTTVDSRHKLFRRRNVSIRPYYVPRVEGVLPTPDLGVPARRPSEPPDQDFGRIGRDLLVDRYGPASILISQEGEPLHFYGDVSRFVRLGSGSGKVDVNLMTIIDPSLRGELRVLMHRCNRDHASHHGQVHTDPKTGGGVRMSIHAVDRTRSDERLYLVSFEERDPVPQPTSIVAPERFDDATVQQIAALEQELKATKENLQTVVEELETSNEELQSTNEELQASNEELQASNEELETANEELQATNEELTTVNDELSVKTGDLAEANSELEGIMTNSAEGIVLIDPTFHVVRSNEKAARILRLSADVDRHHLLDLATFVGAPTIRPAIDATLKTGSNHAEELQIQDRLYLMQVSAHRIEKRIRGAILTLSDITELRTAQRIAAEEGQRARTLIETSTDGIVIADRQGLVHVCNPAACAILDSPESSILGRPARGLFLGGDANTESLVDHLLGGEQPDRPKRSEIAVTRRGRTRHFDAVLSEFTLSGAPYRAATLREITELHDARESLAHAKKVAEQSNRAKTEFLTRMSHELRTPLNAIVGFSDAILSEIHGRLPHDRYLSYVHDIHTSGVHLLGLINDVFDIAKVEAGVLRLHEVPVDLVKLVSGAVSFVGPMAAKAGVTVVFDFEASAVCLRADELRVRQVLLNLLSNAIKFSHRGGKIRVTVRSLDSSGVVVEVADQGIGIEAQTIEKIGTEPVTSGFVRGGEKEGSGLGLPVSMALMKALGGALTIDSTRGKGTTVSMRFPADRVLPSEALTDAPSDGRPDGGILAAPAAPQSANGHGKAPAAPASSAAPRPRARRGTRREA